MSSAAELKRRRTVPFAVGGTVLAIVSVAVARLPDPFIAWLRDRSPLTHAQGIWAFRLLAAAALAQAMYGALGLLAMEKVADARRNDPKFRAKSAVAATSWVARTALMLIFLTLVYALTDLGITGRRGDFIFFVTLCIAQGAWYFRQTGQIAAWLSLQKDDEEPKPKVPWEREPPDYCPPLARGMTPPLQPNA